MVEQISRHIEVDYDDPQHKYYLGDRRYTSSTQLLPEFVEEFDTEERAEYMAYRYGNTPQYWKDKWKQINADSLERGNGIHNAKEEYLYGRGVDTIDGQHLPVQNRALFPKNFPYFKLPDGVYPELKWWRHDHQIAGRADKSIIRTVARADMKPWKPSNEMSNQDMDVMHAMYSRRGYPVRVLDLEDYKTNKKIHRESFYTRENGVKKYRMMKGPLSHLMDCELNHYTIQLSIYQFMGEYHGFLPGYRKIIHYQHEIEGLGVPTPVEIQLPYLRDEVIAMMEYRKQRRN